MHTLRVAALELVLVSAVTVPVTLLAAVPSHAEPLTCQGKAVTVAGNTGTSGDDVMVVGQYPAGAASAGEGNDLVCVRLLTGGREPFAYGVDAGPGDDTVVNESTDRNTRLTVVLGTGSDTYVGSDVTGEAVYAGTGDWTRLGGTTDTEKDVVDTRGGDDTVYTGSVDSRFDNHDQVTLGEGDDALHWAGVQVGPVADLGGGDNALTLYRGLAGNDLLVDAPAAAASVDGKTVVRWTGSVRSYVLTVDNLRTRFVGTDAAEYVTVSSGTPVPAGGLVPAPSPDARRSFDLRGGDDTLVFHDMAGGELVGGAGTDRIEMGYCSRSVVRLGATYTCLVSFNPSVEYSGAMDAWEDVTLAGNDLRVVGSDGPDSVYASGYLVRVSGRGGDDDLSANRPNTTSTTKWPVLVRGGDGDDLLGGTYSPDRLLGGAGNDRLEGLHQGDLLLGGPGRDRLLGGKGPDRLGGGTGRDKADGEAGRDACSAEVRRSCER